MASITVAIIASNRILQANDSLPGYEELKQLLLKRFGDEPRGLGSTALRKSISQAMAALERDDATADILKSPGAASRVADLMRMLTLHNVEADPDVREVADRVVWTIAGRPDGAEHLRAAINTERFASTITPTSQAVPPSIDSVAYSIAELGPPSASAVPVSEDHMLLEPLLSSSAEDEYPKFEQSALPGEPTLLPPIRRPRPSNDPDQTEE